MAVVPPTDVASFAFCRVFCMVPFLSLNESTTAALPGHSGVRLAKLCQSGLVFVCVEITGLFPSVGEVGEGGGNVDGNDIPLSL